MQRVKWVAAKLSVAMSRKATGDDVAKCGDHPASESDSCKRQAGWGTSRSDGPCKDHTPSEWDEDNSAKAESEAENTLIYDEVFYEENADFLLTLMGLEEPWKNHSAKSTVAKKAIKSHDGSQDDYREMFGACSHPDCESGCNGFESETCYEHRDFTEGDDDDTGETGGNVSLSDLSDEDKQKLVNEVINSL
jgi:hypothetical protein